MSPTVMNTEAELRHAVIDRLIAASLSDGKAREATLDRWRAIGKPVSAPGEAGSAL